MAFSLIGLISVVHEFFLNYLYIIVPVMVVDIVLLAIFFTRAMNSDIQFKLPIKASIIFGALVFVVSVIILPYTTKSSWAMLSGIDYAMLIGSGIGFGVLYTIAVFPLMLNLFGVSSGYRRSHA
ncbi:hypothetical protein SAMN05216526_0050 [Ectothiorhodosinus mongolicus]|uniref:Uncharacterized protein n=1 Tax=Ectothiorhodosinus mongolicus TaxID=233100 RepID=A0A1R3VR49_9GAMM|nr:hypothetical protein [Ectothiorhodosinus mongolicus]ULX57744.1 hypothetical protein CKX93_08815 [Ectothiorhodosinus mongolicus]SIT65602.1 hypothetical protein SAMN05216526_0050 [Ectothiorhodosinus mongolicus]